MSETKTSLVDEVAGKIIHKIEAHELKAGDKLPSEQKLAEMMFVSRNTIRSALNSLSTMGIITTKHGSGSYICRTAMEEGKVQKILIDEEELRRMIQLLIFRKALEPGSAYLAAENRSPEQLEEIRAALQDMIDSLGNVKCYGAADTRFHIAIAKASGNEFFYQAMFNIQLLLDSAFTKMPSIVGMELNVKHHRELFFAIERGDAVSAQTRMFQLIDRSLNMLQHKIGK